MCGRTQSHGDYVLTIKLVSLGLSFLSNSGIVDVAQPLLDRLAAESGELVRLAVVDGDELTFVAKAQGATRGLRYDPDMGLSVNLSCSAAGHAWLSTMTDEQALAAGRASRASASPKTSARRRRRTVKALLAYLRAARKRGFSDDQRGVRAGHDRDGRAGARAATAPSSASSPSPGPLVRLTEERMLALGPTLLATAEEVAYASGASAMFKRRA